MKKVGTKFRFDTGVIVSIQADNAILRARLQFFIEELIVGHEV
jgi:hypothetical protein